MHEASGAGDIRRPIVQIGEVLTTAQTLPAGVGAGQSVEPGGPPFKPAHAAWSGVAAHAAQVPDLQAVVTDMKGFHREKPMLHKGYWPQSGRRDPRQDGLLP